MPELRVSTLSARRDGAGAARSPLLDAAELILTILGMDAVAPILLRARTANWT